jgi:glycosyltransferase involved in cell wall biosynthesis
MRVLVLTAMYPSVEKPTQGTFVKQSVDSLIEAGIDVEVMAFCGSGSLLKYFKVGLDLRKKLRNDSFDVVHAHYGLAGIPARMQTQCPVVITYHGSDLLGEVGPDGKYTLQGRFKVFLGQIMGLMVNQRTVVAPILKETIWHKQAEIIPMGVDMETFYPHPKAEARNILNLDPTRKIVLFLANPSTGVKRYDVAKAAVDILQADDDSIQLLPVFQATHEEVPLYLSAADTLVLTSSHEASPCVIKEALACNLPIVSVDVGDVAYRIADTDGCYLCERTPTDVANKLRLALEFEGRTNGRNKVEEISLPRTAAATIAVFRKAMGQK